MKKYFLLFILVICLQNVLHAQVRDLQTACATTSEKTIGNFTISYTIGEMVLIDTWKKDGLTISQGILQPEIAPFSTGANNFATGEITVYPNPTPKELYIRYNIFLPGKLSIQLYDALGQKLLTDEITINSFGTKNYDFSKYASAAYMLMIQYTSADGATIKKGKYKVIKGQ
jgi:Secretion system C-terminal sorting domain